MFRQSLTHWLLIIFAGTLGGELLLGLVGANMKLDLSAVRDPLHDATVAEIGILGIVIGFYFGERRR